VTLWTAPKGWAIGEHLSAALLNTYLRDNLLALRTLNDRYSLLYLSGSQSIPDNVWTNVVWTTVLADDPNGGLHQALPTHVLTMPVNGWYELTGTVEFTATGAGLRGVRFVTDHAVGVQMSEAASSDETRLSFSDLFWNPFGPGAGVYLQVYQSSGGSLNLTGSSPERTRVSWRLVGE
jgi:hypothetical protein